MFRIKDEEHILEYIYLTIMPMNKSIKVEKGSNLLDSLYDHGFMIPSSCGKKGICGKCKVEIEYYQNSDSIEKKKSGKLLVHSCQFAINENIIVYLPPIYIHDKKTSIQYTKPYTIRIDTTLNPYIQKAMLHIKKPTFDDTRSYLTRLFQKIGERHVSIKVLQQLLHKIRETNFSGVLIYNDEEILDWLPENECKDIFGVAIDLGTTSVGIELVNLSSGESVGTLSELNPQVLYGDDVISRISYATQSENNLKTIQRKVITGINNIIERLIDDTGIEKQSICDGVIAGNTTMLHLLLGVNPVSLGECPFVPVFDTSIKVSAAELGIDIPSTGQLYIFPSIGGFIGGDIVSGLIALNLFEKKEPFLFVDLGTNGEIVLGNHEQFWATSTAVGPAFEGARIECGMRAATGAIEHIIYDGKDIKIQTIDNVEPIGLCGSALIDLLAILLQLGLVDITGRMLSKEKILPNIPQKIRERIKKHDSEVIFEVFNSENNDKNIFLSAKDVRQLQLACAAIKCGIKLLTNAAKIKMNDIENIYIAGTFGYHLDKKSLKTIGIIPYEVDDEKIHFVGNTSLAGAKYALLNKNIRNISEEFARSIKHIDLSTIPAFEEEFAMSTYFPEQSQKTNG